MPAPNIFKFFKPRKDQPLAKKGMAEFLAASGKAWATLDVLGGEVSWDHGRPMIIAPGGGGGGDDQLDHSFMPVDNGTTASLTGGYVIVGSNKKELKTLATWNYASNRYVQVSIDWGSTLSTMNNPTITIEHTSTLGTDTATKWYIPIADAGAGATDLSNLVRFQTSNIIVPDYPMPVVSSDPASLAWDGSKFSWADSADSFDVRGDKGLFKIIALRAYLKSDDSIVAPGTAFSASAMYLHPTWDYERWP